MGLASALSPGTTNEGTGSTGAFDSRIVRLGLNLPAGPLVLDGVAISATGQKFGSANQNQCSARVYNLTKPQQNYILTQASPLLQPGKSTLTPILMTLDVGRLSTGTFRLFEGNILAVNVTQPPDIGILLESLTNSAFWSTVRGVSQPENQSMFTICQSIAAANSLTLDFQATDKQIANFSYSGGVAGMVREINKFGGVVATVDNSTLLVLDANKPRKGSVRVISASTGMVGVPQVTEYGCVVKVMIDSSIQLLGSVKVVSEINPAVNGEYKVIKIGFDVANREEPFYYTLVCSNQLFYQGTQ